MNRKSLLIFTTNFIFNQFPFPRHKNRTTHQNKGFYTRNKSRMNRHCVRNYIDCREIHFISYCLSKEVNVVDSNIPKIQRKTTFTSTFQISKSISKSWTCICYFFSCRCTRAFNFVPNVILDPAGGLFYVSFWCIVYLLLDIKARTNAITERITKNWKLEIVVCIWLELF